MRSKLIAGNWKMNKTIGEALDLVKALHDSISKSTNVGVVVAPPYTAINKVAECLQNSSIQVSAQDLFWEDAGAFTGAISAPMIKDAGATYCIIGHSEKRQFFHETDETINKKIKAALAHELIPIFCLGETLAQRESGQVEVIIKQQFTDGLRDIATKDIARIIIAYEPVWAIGTGKTATPTQAEEVHAMIRELLIKEFGPEIANGVKILYGGSVKAENTQELLSQPNIDGALVGGASLKPADFIGIINNAQLLP